MDGSCDRDVTWTVAPSIGSCADRDGTGCAQPTTKGLLNVVLNRHLKESSKCSSMNIHKNYPIYSDQYS